MARGMKPTPVTPQEQKLEKFKRDLECDGDLSQDTREAANEDMRFINVPGGMWEGEFEEFGNRCKLELDKCSDYVQRFVGEWNQNRVGVDFRPDDHNTSDDAAELLNGIYRADFRRSYGKLATDNAVDEVATCGYGAMMLASFFVDDEDPENDNQRVEWRPIYNAYNTVIWDKAAKRLDKSDARWCHVLWPFTKDEFDDQYPDFQPTSAYDPNTFNVGSHDRRDTIYIAARYELVRRRRTVFVYNNLATSQQEIYDRAKHEEEKARLRSDPGIKFVRKRSIVQRFVEKTLFSGSDILEETARIAGKHIPIVPFYGYRSYVDGIENYRGLVRKLKDACRLFNMLTSQWAENSASAGNETPIFTTDQMQGDQIREIWADLTNKPYLLVNPITDESGNRLPGGPVGYLKPPQLDGSTVALAGSVSEFIQSMTGGVPQDTIDPDASGKAIRALMKRENMTTQVVNDNIATAVSRSGTVFQSIAAEIYDNQDVVRVVGIDGEESQERLVESAVGEGGTIVRNNKLHNKRFHSYADVGPQYETLREESVENMKGFIDVLNNMQGGEQYAETALAALVSNIEGTGLEPLKEQNRKIMLSKGLVEPETDEDKEFMQQLAQQSQQPDPQQQLIVAAVTQALAESRNLEAASIEKLASARLKEAQTVETFADIDDQRENTALKAQDQAAGQRQQILDSLSALPINTVQ